MSVIARNTKYSAIIHINKEVITPRLCICFKIMSSVRTIAFVLPPPQNAH